MFIRRQRSENSPATTQNSLAKFRSFSERALLFHNNSPATLHYSHATTILNETLYISSSVTCIVYGAGINNNCKGARSRFMYYKQFCTFLLIEGPKLAEQLLQNNFCRQNHSHITNNDDF